MITLDDDANEKSGMISLSDNETGSADEHESIKYHTGKDKKPSVSINKADKSLVTVKSYKVNDPLEMKPRRGHPGVQQTADAMGSIGNYFSASSVRDRDETRTVQAMQQAQLQAAQTELRELRSQVTSLQEQCFSEARHRDAEAHRADQAESEIKMLKTVYEMSWGSSHRHRRRSRSPSSDSDSPKHYKKHSHRRQRSQSYSKSPARPQASSSKHTLDDDEGMLVKMTPKKNKDGQFTRVEVTPA